MSYDTYEKRPDFSRLYDFSYGDFEEIVAGETISSADPVTADQAGLTIGAAAIAGSRVQVRISGGTSGKTYLLTSSVLTSGGNRLSMQGALSVP